MFQSALEKNPKRPITWIHGCRNQEVHAFGDKVLELTNHDTKIEQYVFYDQITKSDAEVGVIEGSVIINKIPAFEITSETQFYICGPAGFIKK